MEGQHVLAFSTKAYLTGESSRSSQFVPVEHLCKATTPRTSIFFSLIQTVSTLYTSGVANSTSKIPLTPHRGQGGSFPLTKTPAKPSWRGRDARGFLSGAVGPHHLTPDVTFGHMSRCGRVPSEHEHTETTFWTDARGFLSGAFGPHHLTLDLTLVT